MGSATMEEDSGYAWTKKPCSQFQGIQYFPAFCYLKFPGPDETGERVALMTTHVDDLLIAHTEKGSPFVEKLLEQFAMASLEQGSFRFCGKQFV